MACFKILSLLTVLSLLFSATTTVTAISTDEVDAVLLLLRAQGHMLFANAISTSDMLFDILSLPTLTLLAPTDPTLFALDMTNTPPFYISTLRLHALPLRLSWSQLRFLPNGSFLPTLLPSRQLRVVRRQQVNTFVVDGGSAVEVVMPGLYYGSDVAVHALGGILTFRSKIPTDNNNNNRTTIFIPRISNTSSPSTNNTNRTVFFPPLPRIPNILPIINHTIPPPHINRTNRPHPPFNHANRTGFSLVNHTNSSPVNRTIVMSPPVPAPSPAPAAPAPSPAPAAPAPSPAPTAPAPSPAPAASAPLPWSSSGLALSPANSPAPTIPEEPKSRKMREVLSSGEMCAVG